MKRTISFLLVMLIFCMTFPLPVCAATYNMKDTDMSITIDDAFWYVFTRDNLQNNPELDELGLSYDYMYSVLYDNMVYMDAILLYEDGGYLELIIRKKPIDDSFTNLSNYSDELVLELAEAFAKRQNAENYSVYDNQYKFVRLDYFDANYDTYICEFITIVNKDNYTLTFQSLSPFDDGEFDEIEKIVDSVSFDVDTSMEELIPTSLEEPQTPSVVDEAVDTFFVSAISGSIMGVVAILYGRRKKARKTKEENNTSNGVLEPKNVENTTQEISLAMEPNTQVMPERTENQTKDTDEDKVQLSQETTSKKDIETDKCFDDIKKYKELLDLGIITQEEFNAKKRELLGL